MSRIRQINPQFLRSHTMRRVSRDAQLTFIRLWLLVDDAGRARDVYIGFLPDEYATHGLPWRLYPDDKEMWPLVPAWLDELEREGCIVRYTVEDCRYVRVVNWRKYQKISHPTKSRLPAEPVIREGFESRSGVTRESTANNAAPAASGDDSAAMLPNSGATHEALEEKRVQATNGGPLVGFRERLPSVF
jgi:hypothetical protein